jgi:hypothetical protein
VTPQSNFMVAAPIVHDREANLRQLLSTMNQSPGIADPRNPLVPFGLFNRLHFARFVILSNETLGDLRAFGPAAEFSDAPVYLVFLGDCDDSAEFLLAEFANRAGDGLRKIFSFCVGFDSNADLLPWMRSHSVKPSVTYVNWIGRTVLQIREEAELHQALVNYLAEYLADASITDKVKDQPRSIRDALIRAVDQNGPRLTPLAPTPLCWRFRQLLNILAAVIVLFIIALPVLVLSSGAALSVYAAAVFVIAAAFAVFLVLLRRHEITAPDVQSPPKPPSDEHLLALGTLEDHDVTNQYTLFGSFRPGWFSRWTTTVIWWLVNLATPILYPRGNLGRIKTIHSARWVFLDGKRRGLFASNYDGSSESYMDDFVNKVAFGLNLTFGQGVGFPRTYFLLWGGANREQDFKNAQRRHSLPTEVWYKAYPGLTLVDIARNSRIRQGLQRNAMTETEIRQWLAEI